MSRLIDAEALMKNIDEQLASHDGLDMFDKETVYLVGVNDVASYIVTAPTVDAVEVVRCKKCKYLQESGHCDKLSLWIGNKEDGGCDDFFCGFGEPKEVTE